MLMQDNASELPLIKVAQDQKLSKLQADFNAKIKRISELKESIENVKVQIVEINQRLETELTPLETARIAENVAFVKGLEEAYHHLKLSKKDRETLVEMIINEAWRLIEEDGQTEIIPIYDQFSEVPFEVEQKQMQEESRKHAFSMFENMTGMNMNDFGLGENAEDMDDFERIHRLKTAYEERMKQAQWEQNEKNAKRKKSAKQQAKEQKLKEEAELLTKSSRAIYMELAKELHPDREPDEQKRAIKTELLQRITAAYNNNDLYELLRLRLEHKQNELNAEAVPEQQLELYLKILKEQISALQAEYHSFFNYFNPQTKRLQMFGLGKKKNIVTRSINQEKKRIQESIKSLQYTREVTLKDLSEFKQYLREFREERMYDDSLGGLLESLLGGMRR
ncbi:MAG: hypothetical protein EAZ95_03525 [Bacteroidetes bacterium]|nr:MAG: hypothetical protein EAZ95_03525 [Bacteroidota bacterium]